VISGLPLSTVAGETVIQKLFIYGTLCQDRPNGNVLDAIVASQKDAWHHWVKGKIDEGDFRNRALKIEKEGQVEINLSDMPDHIKPD
jgi:hypothetical protein